MKIRLLVKSVMLMVTVLALHCTADTASAEAIFISDFFMENRLEETAVRYSFHAGSLITENAAPCHTLNISYIAHSQSGTNYRLNSVVLRLFRNAQLIEEKTDLYPSQSSYGTPVPGYRHVQTFENIPYAKGDAFEVELEVRKGDYINYVSAVHAETCWNVPDADTPAYQTDFSVQEHIENQTVSYQFPASSSVTDNCQSHSVRVSYVTHSQSDSNMKKNGVKILLKKSNQIIGWAYDQYDSESVQGTIPAYEHVQIFRVPTLVSGDVLTLEFTVWTGDYIHYVSSVKAETGWYMPDQISVIPDTDLIGIRNNYQNWAGNIPLGDVNRDNIGNLNPNQRLAFSESVSYALFSHVLQIEGEDENSSKSRFADYWNWAKEQLMRKNISTVCSWNYDKDKPETLDLYKKCIPMPEDIKDNLMAWRWVPESQCPQECSGIIYQFTDPNLNPEGIKTFQDGSQVASDGDLLTAYALYLAYKRGWGNVYLEDAKAIVQDFRKKAVIDFKAGEMFNAAKNPNPTNLFYGSFEDDTGGSGMISIQNETGFLSWCGKYNYLGFWHDPLLDLSDLQRIEIEIKGNTGDNSAVDFRVQDVIEGKETGHVYRTIYSLPLSGDKVSVISLSKNDFVKNMDFGEQSGELDWSRIKNLQFQTGKSYSEYSGTYSYDGHDGMFNPIDSPGLIAWSGNQCYWGGTWLHLQNFSDLKEIRVKIKGSGNVDFMIGDGIAGQTASDGVFYHTGNIALTDQLITHRFQPANFSYYDYSPVAGQLNWSRIRRFQIQVSSSINTRVELESIEFESNDGTVSAVKANPSADACVSVKSVNIILNSGQTEEHDGFHLTSNAHGAAHINVSYFMPFACRVFKEIDPEGKSLWEALIDNTYKDLDASLHLNLHDLDGNAITGNGHLFPNWYQLDKLKGYPADISTQNTGTNVRGFQFGYDAFRTIWYLAYDYWLYHDSRDMELLKKVYPFFQREMENRGFIDPVYDIDGTPAITGSEYTPFGFYAVYLNLFRIMCDNANELKILAMYPEHRRLSGDRVWMKSGELKQGEEEYFMNFWAFFGGYLYKRVSETTDPLADTVSILKILSGVQDCNVSLKQDSSKDGRLGIEDAVYHLQRAAGLRGVKCP